MGLYNILEFIGRRNISESHYLISKEIFKIFDYRMMQIVRGGKHLWL